ncbi:MAG: toxin-antitoxin system TumE family protein [Candidatus Hodarchaeales archaeon]
MQNHPLVVNFSIDAKIVSYNEGFVKITITLVKSFELKVFEYYNVISGVIDYRYHLMDSNKRFIVRWDNAPHFPGISTFPHHQHTRSGVIESKQPSLMEVLDLMTYYW